MTLAGGLWLQHWEESWSARDQGKARVGDREQRRTFSLSKKMTEEEGAESGPIPCWRSSARRGV